MRRALLALAAAAALGVATSTAPELAVPVPLRGAPFVALLGPMRPLVAELLRLRFDRESFRGVERLDDAWNALLLDPHRADDFVHFGWHYLFDAGRRTTTLEERSACLDQGFALLRAGRALHPESAHLPYAEALALDALARHAEPRLVARLVPPGESIVRRVLADFALAFERSSRDERERPYIVVEALQIAGRVLEAPGDGSVEDASLRDAAAALARVLLRSDELPETERSRLEALLGE